VLTEEWGPAEGARSGVDREKKTMAATRTTTTTRLLRIVFLPAI
jgi:hypothetical protein